MTSLYTWWWFFLANEGKIAPKNIIALLLAKNLAKISPTLHPCVVLRGYFMQVCLPIFFVVLTVFPIFVAMNAKSFLG
jgi:hypothetical protein